MFKGVIPRRMGMRRIAGIRISNLCLPNIEAPAPSNLRLSKATLMPAPETFLEGGRMFRNHRELVNFGGFEISSKNQTLSTTMSIGV
jgi:hypothetical protein